MLAIRFLFHRYNNNSFFPVNRIVCFALLIIFREIATSRRSRLVNYERINRGEWGSGEGVEGKGGPAFEIGGNRRRLWRRSSVPRLSILSIVARLRFSKLTLVVDGGLLQDTSRLQKVAGISPVFLRACRYTRARLCTGDNVAIYGAIQ